MAGPFEAGPFTEVLFVAPKGIMVLAMEKSGVPFSPLVFFPLIAPLLVRYWAGSHHPLSSW
jgi:hypothetical protein